MRVVTFLLLPLSSFASCRARRVREKKSTSTSKKKSAVSFFAQEEEKEASTLTLVVDGGEKAKSTRKKEIESIREKEGNEKIKNTPPSSHSLSPSPKPRKKLKKLKTQTPYSLNPSAASCTPFIALPLISCVPAQLGSHPTASGVEHAIESPFGTVASADLEG